MRWGLRKHAGSCSLRLEASDGVGHPELCPDLLLVGEPLSLRRHEPQDVPTNSLRAIATSMRRTSRMTARSRTRQQTVCPMGLRRTVDLRPLITEIQVSPWASDTTFAEVEQLAHEYGCSV